MEFSLVLGVGKLFGLLNIDKIVSNRILVYWVPKAEGTDPNGRAV
jgi:hypothetical protein